LITHDAKSPTYRRLKRQLSEREKRDAGYFRPTAIVNEAWEVTLACAKALQARTILFQCPASFKQTDENVANLEAFFKNIHRSVGANQSIPLAENFAEGRTRGSAPTSLVEKAESLVEKAEFNFCWEPRGDWDPKVVRRICDDLNLCHVVDPFQSVSVTPQKLYFRLHGKGGWRYEYDEVELRELARMLRGAGKSLKRKGVAAYVFFNNARMTEDAQRFRAILEEVSR